tara:strand:- start:3261 stop:9197 length:5937 start_codon:yes stop_codon:yes gene_type:complete
MGLSRLDNFLKSSRGTILYVNPNDLDATDSIENQGNSLTRPFKTIQRALMEASRFSYQRGLNNDRFGKTTILLYPGEHTVDNRPGFIPDGANNYRLRSGATSDDLPAFDLTTNLDLSSPNNQLYKLNSIHGGVIIPRGTSLVGLDLRKTKIRPKYVPNPENDNIERTALFRVTGECYFWQFTVFDADPNGSCYKDYTQNAFVPNFSHHKLTTFEYADGTNNVSITDDFMTFETDRTDLDMYYEKISLVYGQSSGRAISPDYPSSDIDIEAKIDEHRIVGSTGETVGITSIKAGDGIVSTAIVTVTTASAIAGLDVDTPFRVTGLSATGYNGQFVVSEKVNSTEIKYQVQNAPTNALPSVTGSTLSLQSDTVTSSSPYIFNCSLRSVYGMCGLHADGSKATGFKSMVVAQFTGIGLQKDNAAFIKFDSDEGKYKDYTETTDSNLSTNSSAVFKPAYKNYHIKASNNAVIQAVSIFAIGYAEHFTTHSGADMSITNSNSNFGARALIAQGYRPNAFSQDDYGYITHIIPPKEVPLTESAIEFTAIDILKTSEQSSVGVGSTAHLYLYGETNEEVPPENVFDGFRIGVRSNDQLRVLLSNSGAITEYSARIVMPKAGFSTTTEYSSEKVYTVKRSDWSIAGINSIGNNSIGGSDNVITLTAPHTFANGESVRVISDSGQLPDGIDDNTVYYAITGLSTNVNIKLAKSQTEALNGNEIPINSKGGVLKISSRVSDKTSGELGHPIQWDSTESQWYVKVSGATTENTIYSNIVGIGSTALGTATPRTFFKRRTDSRNIEDTLYKVRYVIPSVSGTAVRPPQEGFIIQESGTSIGSTDTEIQTYFGSGSLANLNQQRNFRFINNASWDGTSAVTIDTELPHNLTVGSRVELFNIKSSENTTGAAGTAFNRLYTVTGISSSKQFNVGLTTNPGTYTSDSNTRTVALPYYKRKQFENIFYVYRNKEAQKYVPGEQDGIYYLTVLNASVTPTLDYFRGEKYSQPVKSLYPQTQRDNPISDPDAAQCFAKSSNIGEILINDVRNSITKETANKWVADTDIGIGITEIRSYTGTAHTITTLYDHGFNRITSLSIVDGGSDYGTGSAGDLYNAKLVPYPDKVTGKHATAKITINGSGTITAVKIMDGGSAYGVGNTMKVVGVATTGSWSVATVSVSKIYNNVGDTIRVTGIGSEAYSGYNEIYRITDIPVGAATSITVASATTVSQYNQNGIGDTSTSGSFLYPTGEAIRISALTHASESGIATVTTVNNHGLKVNAKVKFAGASEDAFRGDFVVQENLSLTQFSVKIGITTTATSATGTLYAYREGLSSNDGTPTIEDENLGGRMSAIYAGITTTLSAAINSPTTDEVNLQGIGDLDVNIGDYLMINNEMVRVKTTTTGSNPIKVFRGILGTKRTTHSINDVVRRIKVDPVELRRHSINRASGHTFEYVGFGPGNYSTALPDRQNRTISPAEELLAQSTKREGGINFYTGMNDKGISYSGNKKLSTITGREEIFDTPFPTVTGEDIGNLPSINIVTPVEGTFSRSIKVEGGDDNKVTSQFSGPVLVTNKLTVNSPKGLEANHLFLQGDATISRKYTVGIATPSLAGNPGDVIFRARPAESDNLGWVYSAENDWRRFGTISLNKNVNQYVFDSVGVGTTSPNMFGDYDNTFLVGSGSTQVSINGSGEVGIATTANGYQLHVYGDTNLGGNVWATSHSITAIAFTGDGSGLTNLSNDSAWANVHAGTGNTGIYPVALLNVGIGTTRPTTIFEAGAVGASGTVSVFNGETYFAGIVTARDVTIAGFSTIVGNYNIQNSDGQIGVGIITTTSLHVGTSGTVITGVSTGYVGINSSQPGATLDIGGHTKFITYSEKVAYLSPSSNVVTVDLSSAQTFICTATEAITHFNLTNPPNGSTSFSIRIDQDSTGGRQVGIDTFKTSGGVAIPVYWPGAVVPQVTTTASRKDMYSFKLYDGDNPTSAGLFGIVGGQNFQ